MQSICSQNSNLANNAQAIASVSDVNNVHSNQIATLAQTTQNHETVIGNIQSSLDIHTNAINTNANAINATKSYFFGGTTYATYQDKYLVTKGIALPEEFKNCNTDNYFVSVTMITDYSAEQVYPRVQKANGTFMVYFRSLNGAWVSGSAIWFDYSVIINH